MTVTPVQMRLVAVQTFEEKRFVRFMRGVADHQRRRSQGLVHLVENPRRAAPVTAARANQDLAADCHLVVPPAEAAR